MKYRNLLLIIIPALVFLFSPNYGIQFLALAAFLIFCLSFCYSLVSRMSLKAARVTIIQRTYKNQPLEIRITITNKSLLPLHQLLLYDNRGAFETNGADKILLSVLRVFTCFDLVYTIKGSRRGEYRVGPLVAKGADPLGLFPWKKEYGETEKVIIYPAVFTLNIKDDKGLPCGSIRSDNPVFEDITNYKLLREYQPGDDLRRVNWKVSARMGSLYTMQYLPSLHYAAIILLNLQAEDYPVKYRYTLVEAAVETAASLVYHCIYQKQEASLVTSGNIGQKQQIIAFPLRKDEAHAVQILETLARIAPDTSSTDVFDVLLNPGISIPWNCRIFYVGPAPGENQLSVLQLLKNRGIYPELFLVTSGKESRKEHINYRMPLYYYDNLEANRW